MAHSSGRMLALLSFVAFTLITHPVLGDDVRRVHNGATPRDGVRSVVLEELWRVGGDEDGMILGRVPRVDTDGQGNVYILDSQLCRVHVYSPAGELLRTVFREGEGPGEARGPKDMLLMPDGRVGLALESLGIVKFVDAGGVPAGSLRIGAVGNGNYALMSGVGTDGSVVLSVRHSTSGETMSIRNRRNYLARCDLDGLETAVYTECPTIRDLDDFTYRERDEMLPFYWGFDVGADGRVFAVVDRNEYAVAVYAPDGTPELVIDREYPPFIRSRNDRERLAHMVEASMEGMPFETNVELEDTYPAIAALHRGLQAAPDGSPLWVLSGRGLRPDAPGIMAVYDVFDREGVFVRQVALAALHDGTRVGIVLAGPDRVIVVEGFLESLASMFGNGATFNGEEWRNPEVIVYGMSVR